MKPTPHSAIRNTRRGAHERGAAFPLTDSAYQSIALEGYRGGRIDDCGPSFRNISNDYFKTEARHNFAAEAALFALMVVISSWPMLLSIQAMTGLVRAYAGL